MAADVQFTELRDIFNSLNAKHAQATVEEDRRRILADIEVRACVGVGVGVSVLPGMCDICAYARCRRYVPHSM